ncbi:MAG: hypothetical protein DHS20C16_04940 [Phycisphaerae bacterium]|nr:MAG: hypothetical protein DHS20C16_04940 [Phycisphaerae bacterium]
MSDAITSPDSPMTEQVIPVAGPEFLCPNCMISLELHVSDPTRCPNCGWHGTVLTFNPLELSVDSGELALADDATCVHHPTKRAEAVCDGTGDYICALCSIEHEGNVYSAEYLNTAGAKIIAKGFDRRIERPDSTVILYMGLCFVPYVNALWYLGWPVWVTLGWMKLFKARRAISEDQILARVVSPARIIIIGILFAFVTLLFLILTVYFFIFLADLWTEGFEAD